MERRGAWVPAGRERPERRWHVGTSKHHIQDSPRGSFLISSLTPATWDGAGPTPAPPSGTWRGGQEVTDYPGPVGSSDSRGCGQIPHQGSQRLGRGRTCDSPASRMLPLTSPPAAEPQGDCPLAPAPEVLRKKNLSQKHDLFSGCKERVS